MAKAVKYTEPNDDTYFNKARPKPKLYDFSVVDKNDKTVDKSFIMKYIDVNGKPSVLNFVLPPAVEHALQYTPSGMLKGNVQTPQTKPGLPAKTQIKVISMGVPGGKPIQQVSGIQGSVYEFVGALTGGEVISTSETMPKKGYIYRPGNATNTEDPWEGEAANAASMSIQFDRIVQLGREVTIEFKSDFKLKYTGIIAVFEQYFRWSNRVYYMIKMVGTRYGEQVGT